MKRLFLLLLCATALVAYADKPKKQNPLLTGPVFVKPYFDAFGTNIYNLDETPASSGCVDINDRGIRKAYYYVAKKNAETSLEYSPGEKGNLIDHINYDLYREFPSLDEIGDFFWNEIPTDWVEISKEEFKEHTTKKAHMPQGICSEVYLPQSKCYRLPKIEGKPTIYANARSSAYAVKKKVGFGAFIDYWLEGGELVK